MTPFAALPFATARSVFLLISALSIGGALALLGVRDWRCYGAAFLWIPVLGAVRLGTLTPLLTLGAAAAWRFRDRRLAAALVVGAVVVAKVFLWPLIVWLVATRRAATALLAGATAIGLTVVAWAALGFRGFLA